MKKKIKKKLPSLAALRKKAWTVWSLYIRFKYADWRGYVKCVTCPYTDFWRSGIIQAGHFQHGWLDFDEQNIHPQCAKCNLYGKGMPVEYAAFLVRTYGPRVIDDILKRKNEQRQKSAKYSRIELLEIIEKYKNETHTITRQVG